MRMCTFSTQTSWCLNSSGQGSRTTCRFIPTSDTASDVQSLGNITKLRCCTSCSRTSDKPFYTLTFTSSLSTLLSLSPPPLPSIYLNPSLSPVEFKLCQTSSHLKSCLSVSTVWKHFSINKSLQD